MEISFSPKRLVVAVAAALCDVGHLHAGLLADNAGDQRHAEAALASAHSRTHAALYRVN